MDSVQALVTVTILEELVVESVSNSTVSYYVAVHINSSFCNSKQERAFQITNKLICFNFFAAIDIISLP